MFETFLLYSGHIHTSPNSSEISPCLCSPPAQQPLCFKPIESNWLANILIYLPLPFSVKIATLCVAYVTHAATLVQVMGTLCVRAEGSCLGRPSVPFRLLYCLAAGILVKSLPSGWPSALASSHFGSKLIHGLYVKGLLSSVSSIRMFWLVPSLALCIGTRPCPVYWMSLFRCLLSPCLHLPGLRLSSVSCRLDSYSHKEDASAFPGKRALISFLSWFDYCDQLIKEAQKV